MTVDSLLDGARVQPLLPLFSQPLGRTHSASLSRRVQARHNRVCAVTDRANAAVVALNSLSSSFSQSQNAVPRWDGETPAQARAKAVVWDASDRFVRRLAASSAATRGDELSEFQTRILSRSGLDFSCPPSTTNALPIVASRVSLPAQA